MAVDTPPSATPRQLTFATMDAYEDVLRWVLAEPGAVNSDRLRSLLLDSPASVRRDARAVVPAIVAAFEAGITTSPGDTWTALHHRLTDRGDLASDNIENALATWARVLDRTGTNIDTPPGLRTDPGVTVDGHPSVQQSTGASQPSAVEAVATRLSVCILACFAAAVSVICIAIFIGMAAGKLGNPAAAAWLVVPAIGLASGTASFAILRANQERRTSSVTAPTSSVDSVSSGVPDGQQPAWLTERLMSSEQGRGGLTLRQVTRFDEPNGTYYYVESGGGRDLFTDLHDADGRLLGHPSGGFIGRGDGSTRFEPTTRGIVIWMAN